MAHHNRRSGVPERILKQLWLDRRFRSAPQRTSDGRTVSVLFPGTPNPDGGPDFLDARVVIDGILYRGDIEFHQREDDWVRHRHNSDSKYNRVILHVVLFDNGGMGETLTKSSREVPVVSMQSYVTNEGRPFLQEMYADDGLLRSTSIPCAEENAPVDASLIRSWVEKLAEERMELKVRRFEERLKELVEEKQRAVRERPRVNEDPSFRIDPDQLPTPGRQYAQTDFAAGDVWRQLLYEGAMEGLGFSKNRSPFLRLADNLRISAFDRLTETEARIPETEGILFGVAGLLPKTSAMRDNSGRRYVRRLRGFWRRFRPTYRRESLSEADWQFFRLRPENFPTVRLAAAARLIHQTLGRDRFRLIVQAMKAPDLDAAKKFKSFRSMFLTLADGYWTSHYRFGEKSGRAVTMLVGGNRANEIVLNTLIPLCLLYARIFKDKDARRESLKMYAACPPPGPNRITRTVESHLVREKFPLDSALLQQGAIHLYKYYCMKNRCQGCNIGKAIPQNSLLRVKPGFPQ